MHHAEADHLGNLERVVGVAIVDGVEGENTIMHMSNTLPDIRIGVHKNAWEETLLSIGSVVSLNQIHTKKGWTQFGLVIVGLLLLKLFSVAKAVLHKRRHLRALDDVKKM